ncbi:uncharacterized protein TNIN_108351 [Trichonephila inaurata madagascariensis]|nr:uncharacterized protein TNIN_108351 [Trichonephila inaurata madagascariensis]
MLRDDSIHGALQPPYSGPYHILQCIGKGFVLRIGLLSCTLNLASQSWICCSDACFFEIHNYAFTDSNPFSILEGDMRHCSFTALSFEPKAASFPSASSVSVSSNSLPPSPSKSSTRISTQGRRCSLPAASPVSTPSLPPISQKSFGRKKERSTWTRKLSSVTDEKEEIEPSSLDSRIFEEMSQEQFMLRAFLQQVERKNHEFCKHVENELDELPDETDSADDKTILNCIQNSAVGSFLSTPVIQELWQQNSTCTLARYFCSTILAFIALYFLLSLILPCVGFIPEVIANLSQAEQKLISRIIPFVKIIKSSGVFGQYSFGGQAVLFSQDDFEVTENLPNMLPRSSNNAEMAVVSERLKNIKEMR